MTFKEEDIDDFLNRSSILGRGTLYVISVSFEKSIAFNFNEFFKKIYANSYDYCYGYLIACTSFGLITFNYKNGIMTVTDVNPILAKKIKKSYESTVDANDKVISEVENYFS